MTRQRPAVVGETVGRVGSAWVLGRRPSLDGVRGIAMLMVFIGHAGWPWQPNRAHEFGVELFFVLSGFLITSLLIEEQRETGRIDLLSFYGRRARRLLPALAPVLVVVLAIAVLTDRFVVGETAWGVLGGATYSSNILIVNGVSLGPLAHLWSLSVEEHFYLVWPFLVAIALRRATGRRTLWWGLGLNVALLSAVVAWRWHLVEAGRGLEWTRMYSSTDVRIAAPLVGCLLAFIVNLGVVRVPPIVADLCVAAGAATLAWLATAPSIVEFPQYWTRALPLGSAAALLVCLGCAGDGGRAASVFGVAGFRWVGRMSYAAYLWHYPIFLLVGGELTTMSTTETAVAVALTMIVAVASGRLIEARFRTHRRPAGRGPISLTPVADTTSGCDTSSDATWWRR